MAFVAGPWCHLGKLVFVSYNRNGRGAHPLDVNYWQSLIGGAVVLISSAIVTRQSLPVGRTSLLIYFLCRLLGSAIPGLLYFYAITHVSPGVLAITIATVPIMTFIAAALIKIERRSFLRMPGVSFGVLSIVLLVAPTETLPGRSTVPWIFSTIASATCYTGDNLVIALRLPEGANAFLVVGGMLITATLIMTPCLSAPDTFVPLGWRWKMQE